MSPKTLLILALVTVALAAAAFTLDSGRQSASEWKRADELLFPGLAEKALEVTSLTIESVDGVTTVEKSADDWVVAERGGYPGRGDEVKRVLNGLTLAKRVEPKTKRPENYERLGLAGFEDEASTTTRVTARDGSGEVLADVFIGRRRYHGGGESWYVREPDDATTWAVEGKLRVPRRTSEWLDAELMSIGRDRIVDVMVEHAGGERIELAREDTTATGFELLNLPEGRETKSPSSGSTFVGALDRLRFEDVLPAAQADLAETPDTVTTFTTEDGLRLVCELWNVDEDLLCRFKATVDESRAPVAEMGPALDAPQEGEELASPGDSVPGDSDREDLESEVAEINGRTEGWVYTLQSWKKTSFTTSMEDLLKELPGEDEVDDETPAPVVVPPPGEADGAMQQALQEALEEAARKAAAEQAPPTKSEEEAEAVEEAVDEAGDGGTGSL
jgi:Domain of unknown function (DUF4340)